MHFFAFINMILFCCCFLNATTYEGMFEDPYLKTWKKGPIEQQNYVDNKKGDNQDCERTSTVEQEVPLSGYDVLKNASSQTIEEKISDLKELCLAKLPKLKTVSHPFNLNHTNEQILL